MSNLKAATLYLCREYPHPDELSKARLTKMLYLADWRSCLVHGRQLTDISWVFNHFGPYVDAVYDMASSDSDFLIERTSNMYGDTKNVITAASKAPIAQLPESDRLVLDHVIETTKYKTYTGFIKLVYSTFPIVSQSRYTELDLVALASKYKQLMKTIDDF